MCLLNLPDTVLEFGSLRNYFEGKYLGERYVQEVKDAREHTSNRDVTFYLMRELHQGKALESMAVTQSKNVRVFKTSTSPNKVTKRQLLSENVRIYRDKASATVGYHARKPISGVQTQADTFGILFYENGNSRGKVKLLVILRAEEGVSVCHGLRYWKWSLSDIVVEFDDWELKDFVVLLQKDRGEEGEYTMVSKEWSPAMLEHYEYSSVGIDTKPKMEEHVVLEGPSGKTTIGRTLYSI